MKNFSFSEEKIVTIEEGDTFYSLPEKFWISGFFFKLYLRLSPPTFTLQKWTYKIEPWKNLPEIINWLKKPISNDLNVTILEGRNIYDIDTKLTSLRLIKSGDFSKSSLSDFQQDFTFLKSARSLEGFLYPDTYSINPNNFSVSGFIKQMLINFNSKVIKKEYDLSSKEWLQIIKYASIVEKEEKAVSEKPTVAWILKKRVAQGWMIGADATVCYPYKLTFDECTPSFIVEHIADKNKYNTRTMAWLPETPISNPSFETIDSVIHSQDSEFFFYLHDSSGNIHYAKTNEEHVQNKNLYLK